MKKDAPRDPVLDERLARLGRDWYADVRRQHPDEARTKKTRRDGGDGGDGGLFDWLFGDADSSSGGDSGGGD